MDEDYPRSLAKFELRFRSDADCIKCMAKLRWPSGFVCPRCGESVSWQTTPRSLWHCWFCAAQTSVTAGAIFNGSRKSLVLWFRAMWHITSQKYGANALGLNRTLDLGSYETAWQWLQKLRRAMVRPGRDQLAGPAQVDESYVGVRKKPGKRGRGAAGKALVAIAVQDKGPVGMGRIRLSRVPDASNESLGGFVSATVEKGYVVTTEDGSGYFTLPSLGYERVIAPAEDLVLPHLVASLLKRWLLGTY